VKPSLLGRAKELDDCCFSLKMTLEGFPHDHLSPAGYGQQHVIIKLQHPRQLAQDMRCTDAMVDRNVNEVLWADRSGVCTHNLVAETAQGQSPRLARLFDDLSEAWGMRRTF
jgi:hypothetical protein